MRISWEQCSHRALFRLVKMWIEASTPIWFDRSSTSCAALKCTRKALSRSVVLDCANFILQPGMMHTLHSVSELDSEGESGETGFGTFVGVRGKSVG